MKQLGLIFKNSIKRSRILLVLAVVGACALCFVYLAGKKIGEKYVSGQISVGMIDRDGSVLSNNLKVYLEETLNIKIMESQDFDKLEDELLNADISVIVELPQEMEKDILEGKIPGIKMTHLEDYANRIFTESYLQAYMHRAALLAEGARGEKEVFYDLLEKAEEETLEVQMYPGVIRDVEAEKSETGITLTVGFYLMFLMSFTMYMAMIILEDKGSGTFQRIKSSPVRPWHYISGQILGTFIICSVFTGIILGYWKVTGCHMGIPFWILSLLLVLYILFSIGFSLILAFAMENRFALSTAVIGFGTMANILGGAWFPLAEHAGAIKKLSILVPHYWIMDTIRNMQEDGSFDYRPSLTIVLLFTVFVYLIAAVLYNKKEN